MTQGTVVPVRNAPIQRKDYGLGTKNAWRGLMTVPFYGVGDQIVQNMRYESGFYRKMFGNSEFADLSGESSVIESIILTEQFDKGDGTFQRIEAFRSSTSPDRFKIRALEDDGTITTPTGGAGDVAFTSDIFSWVQIGLNGYLSNRDTAASTKNLHSWNGTALTFISNAPDNPDFIDRDGQRIALGAQGIMSFSQRSTAVLTSFTGGTSTDQNGNYNVSNPGNQTGAIAAAGGIVIFFQRGAELHKVSPNAAGDDLSGETRISGATGATGWNYNGNSIKNNFQLAADPNFLYIINDDGLIRIDPLTGQSTNLVEGNGAIQALWETLDIDDARLVYSPQDLMICVTTKVKGTAVNDRLVCWDTKEEQFYIKPSIFATSLGVIDNQLFSGENSGSLVFKVFDETTFEDGSGGTVLCRIKREKDGLGGPKIEKRLRRSSVFVNIHPNSKANVSTFLNGVRNSVNTYVISGNDIEDTSDLVETLGEYIWASGGADPTENVDVVKSSYFTGRFGLISMEICENSTFDFRIYNYTVLYAITPTIEATKLFVNQSYPITPT